MIATGMALGVSVIALLIGLTLMIVSEPWSEPSSLNAQATNNLVMNNKTAALQYWIALHNLVRNEVVVNDDGNGDSNGGGVSGNTIDMSSFQSSSSNLSLSYDTLPPVRPGSKAWKALHWMTKIDPLAGSLNKNHRAVQRYALAALYFGWNAPQGWQVNAPQDGWIHHVTDAVAAKSSDYTVTYQEIRPDENNAGQNQTITRTVAVPLHECEWLGVTCNDDEQIVELDMGNAAFVLHGSIPTELGLLSHLINLNLADHSLKGHLPDVIFPQLTSLTSLDLSGNQLTGLVAGGSSNQEEGLGQWTAMRIFRAHSNQLQGRLPTSSLAKWKQLELFDIHANAQLSGLVWEDCVPHWPQLQELNIFATQLSGNIPDVVVPAGTLSQIQAIYAATTHTSGTLPESLSLATKLSVLSINEMNDGKQLDATQMPTSFGALTNLVTLELQNSNALNGTLPTEIGRWTKLQKMNLHLNSLTGTLPTEIGLLTDLKSIELYHTELTGTVPTELGRCTNLSDLNLHETELTGTMPMEVCSVPGISVTAECSSQFLGEPALIECSCCSICY